MEEKQKNISIELNSIGMLLNKLKIRIQTIEQEYMMNEQKLKLFVDQYYSLIKNYDVQIFQGGIIKNSQHFDLEIEYQIGLEKIKRRKQELEIEKKYYIENYNILEKYQQQLMNFL